MKNPIFASVLMLLATTAASAAGTPGLSVSGCWIRATPDGGAAYFIVHNDGDKDATLTSADIDAYGMAMLHQTKMVNGMMHMAEADAVPVPAHGDAAFAPGAYHVMLMDPKKSATIGSTATLTLGFKGGASLKSACPIKGPDATSAN